MFSSHRIIQSQEERHAILDAMRRRDSAAMERLVRIHNQGAMTAYAAYLEEQPRSP